MGKGLYCVDDAGRESGAFVLVMAKLETARKLGAGVKPEIGGNSHAFSKEKQSHGGVIGVVVSHNRWNH